MQSIILWYKVNKFYKIFGEVLDYTYKRRISLKECMCNSFGDISFDVAEALEGSEGCTDPMTIWLNALYSMLTKQND